MSLQPTLQHPWDVSPAEARAIQEQLRLFVIVSHLPSAIATVAGVDVSVRGHRAVAAVVVLSYPGLEPVDEARAETDTAFPYVPGLLAFREGPSVLAALAKLVAVPDVLMFDGQGMAHPRRMGLATHLGLLLDVPSVGCAKSRLVGEYQQPGEQRGSWSPLRDGDEVIGAVVRTRDRVQPVFVSVGHRADVETSVSLVLSCATKYRLPEPTRWAHRVAGGEPLPRARRKRFAIL